jgi:hypothetical protein
MPAEIAVHTTGHYLTQLGSIFEYIDATRSLCQPGITVLSGFKPFPYGQLGKGPVPASLSSLEALGVSLEVLDSIINVLYGLDSASPPQFRIEGSLRPAVRAAFASQVMYYQEREKNAEMIEVLNRMRRAVSDVSGKISSSSSSSSSSSASASNNCPLSPEGPHATLLQWSVRLATKFNLDNQHLLGGAGSDALVQLATTVNQLGTNFTKMFDSFNNKLTRVGDRIERRLGEVEMQLNALTAAAVAKQTVAVGNAIPEQSQLPQRVLAAASSSSGTVPLLPPPPPPLAAEPRPSQSSAMGPLVFFRSASAQNPVASLDGVTAEAYYLAFMNSSRNHRVLGAQDTNRARVLVLWFDAMATQAERQSLLPSALGEDPKDVGEQRKLVARLHFLIKALLRTAFKDRTKGVPRDVVSDKALTVGAIQSRIDQLRDEKLPAVKVNDFASFRAQFEKSETNKRPVAAATAAALPSSKRKKANAAAASSPSAEADGRGAANS